MSTTRSALHPIITNFIRLRTVPNNKKYRPESSESSGLLVSSSLQLGLGSEGPGSMSGVSPEGRGISIGSLGVLIAVERHSPPIGACLTSGGIKLLTFSRVAASEKCHENLGTVVQSIVSLTTSLRSQFVR